MKCSEKQQKPVHLDRERGESDERLRQAADLVGLCTYTWDPATGGGGDG